MLGWNLILEFNWAPKPPHLTPPIKNLQKLIFFQVLHWNEKWTCAFCSGDNRQPNTASTLLQIWCSSSFPCFRETARLGPSMTSAHCRVKFPDFMSFTLQNEKCSITIGQWNIDDSMKMTCNFVSDNIYRPSFLFSGGEHYCKIYL